MGTARKIFTGSFWIVMAIHVAVFTSVGLIDGRWTLLVVFLCVLAVTVALKFVLSAYSRRHPEKKKLDRIMRYNKP